MHFTKNGEKQVSEDG